MNQHVSPLDVERFGFNVAKIDCMDLATAKSTLNELEQENLTLIIARANTQDIAIINFLEHQGFHLKDSQVTYRFDMKRVSLANCAAPADVIIRENKPSDTEGLIAMCRDSFMGYGHYFANDKLCKTKCAEIYPDWARRSCTDKKYADKIFVAEMDNKPVGFLSFKLMGTTERYAKGGMGAVAKEYRKFGIFQALIKAGLIWGKEANLVWEEHNVLCTNYPVNRSFSTLGFTITNAFVTMHKWLGD